MTRVILVRHGKTNWNGRGRYQGQTDVPLSEEGLMQAELLAENFNYGHPTAIYSSDLARAKKTADKIADKFGLTVILEPAFREINFGEWEGLSYEEIGRRWPEEYSKFFRATDEVKIPGGETVGELQARAVAALNRLVLRHDGEEFAIVAHGGVLRAIIGYALHIPLKYFWSLRQYNTAVSIITFADDQWNAELINSTAHLGKNLS